MNKTVAKMWAKALRSGKYRQGKHYLKQRRGDDTLHCCLGVLCELHNESMKRQSKRGVSVTEEQDKFSFADENKYLPSKVVKWAGIGCEIGTFRSGNNKEMSLSELNDNGRSFRQIAQIIERNADRL